MHEPTFGRKNYTYPHLNCTTGNREISNGLSPSKINPMTRRLFMSDGLEPISKGTGQSNRSEIRLSLMEAVSHSLFSMVANGRWLLNHITTMTASKLIIFDGLVQTVEQ
jgi:hypothetical protein